MRSPRHPIISALSTGLLAAGLLAAGAAPAAIAKSRGINYAGKTNSGDSISFTLVGSRLTNLKAYVPTVCGTSDPDGTPLSGTDPFDPPGAFPLRRTTRVSAKRPNAIWSTSDVTKNFVVSFKHGRHGVITGKLHSDFSFLMIVYSYPISSRPYVCTGDTTFMFKP
jgi:hypothetical protein